MESPYRPALRRSSFTVLREFALPICVRLLLLIAILDNPAWTQDREVVVYVSHDEEHSREILESFAEETGIKILPLFDTEATKTVGLVTRLINEGTPAKADVFWNNEVGQTLRLQKKGLLEPYVSPSAATIPAQYKDAAGHWTGFAARARVLIWNREKIAAEALPSTMKELAEARYAKDLTMARPRTGTTLTHAGALFARWGRDESRAWFSKLIEGGVLWQGGNGPVARSVAEGGRPFGMTDTDDANGMRVDGYPVEIKLLDQNADGLGTLVIPNTVMMMKGAPHPAEAKALIDWLLRPEVEARLAKGRAAQIPLHPDVPAPDHVLKLRDVVQMKVTPEAMGDMIEAEAADLEALFEEKRDATGGGMTLLIPALAFLFIAIVLVIRNMAANREPKSP